jgi:hypothetical protein
MASVTARQRIRAKIDRLRVTSIMLAHYGIKVTKSGRCTDADGRTFRISRPRPDGWVYKVYYAKNRKDKRIASYAEWRKREKEAEAEVARQRLEEDRAEAAHNMWRPGGLGHWMAREDFHKLAKAG